MPKYGENEVENDSERPNERFSFGEHTVLLSITGLSLLSGLTTSMANRHLFDSDYLSNLFSIGQAVGPLPGVLLIAFLSEVNGRKPVFILLSALATLSSILLAIPANRALILILFSIQAILTGGTQTMIYLAISEYCSPKHRFAYLIANLAACYVIGTETVDFLFNSELLTPGSAYLQSFMIVFGLVCAGCACAWPESPYWLAARGRGRDAARALRRLRGADAARELRQLEQERRTPGPPRLYWKPLLIAIIVLSVCSINSLQTLAIYFYFSPNEIFESRALNSFVGSCMVIVILSIIALISYFVKRKVLYLGCCAIPLVFHYVLGIWMWIGEATSPKAFLVFVFVCNFLRGGGIIGLSSVLFIELIPYKYNTRMSCVCSLYVFLINSFQMLIFAVVDIQAHAFVLVLFVTTLSVLGVGLFYWLAPETGDKTLFEIQKSYTPQQSVTCPEQNETMMEDIHI